MQHGIQVEDFGGDVQAIPISALKGTNLDTLTEAIVLQADIMDLKGDPKSSAAGVIIESKTDPRRGYFIKIFIIFLIVQFLQKHYKIIKFILNQL